MKKMSALIITVAIATACNQQSQNPARDITVPVTVSEVKARSIEQFIEITGTVKPVKEVQLRAELSGNYVLQVNPSTGRKYALGDKISEGSDLILLEDKEFENNIKINSLKLNLEITEQVFVKQQTLYEKGGVTLTELKNAEINYINAKYSYDDALLRLQKMHVKAPFTGIIIDLPYFTPGVRVDANALLAKIMDYSNLYMEVNLPEKNMATTRSGQEVRITNYTMPTDTLKGTVTQLSPAIDAETRSYKGLVIIENRGLLLRPGMYVKGEVVVASAQQAIVIPRDVIVSKQRGNSVFVVEKGIAYEKIVEFGLENPREVQVVAGLKINDRLVVKGLET